jgi:glycosyltransferase involved in cell wall biosynthesis
MTQQALKNPYENALQLAEAGQYLQALECLQQHIQINPEDAEALNDIGAVLHCLGRSEEAVDFLNRAKALQPHNTQITWNLAEAYLALCRPDNAAQLFNDMQNMGILNPDLINRTAKQFVDLENKAQAIEMLIRSLKLAPDQKILQPMLEVIKSKRPRIHFFCGLKDDVKFLTDIYEFTKLRYPVQFNEAQTVESLYKMLSSNDICWFEWCTDLVVQASKLPKVSKNIVRLHRFEAYTDWPAHVKWENIDVLITVGNSYIKDMLIQQVPDIESRTIIATIPNGINLDKFRFTERSRGKNIACIGYLNMRKNPMFLLQCMQKLHFIDPEYKLFFAGNFQDPMLEQYTKYMVKSLGLEDVVVFDGWQQDIPAWLKNKHFIVSSSIGESQGMGVLEGMACGLKPVIHNFPGAEQIFPSEFIFNISEQFCSLVTSEDYKPKKYRKFVEQKYPLRNQLEKINKIFYELETHLNARRPTSLENPQQPADYQNTSCSTENLMQPEKTRQWSNLHLQKTV